MTHVSRSLGTSIVLLLLAACGSTPLSTQNPSAEKLSGRWVLDANRSDAVPDNLERPEVPVKRGLPQTRRARMLNAALGSGLAFVTHDFQVLRAKGMDVELNSDSMGIRYRPGVYRDVSWGERQRGLWEVRAGWLEGDLIIESKADDLFVMERFDLNGDTLSVIVEVRADRKDFVYKRVFARQ